jgi:8-oxo-dGTP pyrophosphatase MutT (NUDIX family)
MSSPAGWVLHDEEPLFSNAHVGVGLARVTTPSGQRVGRHVIRAGYPDVAALVTSDDHQVLLAWRHRFVTGRWGWEIPSGAIHPDEDPVLAAQRVVHQQAGWATTAGSYRWAMARLPDRSDHVAHLVALRADRPVANPNPDEVADLRWWPAVAVFDLINGDAVHDVFTVAALLWNLNQESA